MNQVDYKMSQLCETFPILRGRPGVNPFSIETLVKQLREPWMTTGARHAIRFILGVWNMHAAYLEINDVRRYLNVQEVHRKEGLGPEPLRFQDHWGVHHIEHLASEDLAFNVHEAMALWDDKHRNAFLAWARDPWQA